MNIQLRTSVLTSSLESSLNSLFFGKIGGTSSFSLYFILSLTSVENLLSSAQPVISLMKCLKITSWLTQTNIQIVAPCLSTKILWPVKMSTSGHMSQVRERHRPGTDTSQLHCVIQHGTPIQCFQPLYSLSAHIIQCCCSLNHIE